MRILDPDRYLPASASSEERWRAQRVLIYAALLSLQAVGFGTFYLVRGMYVFAAVIFCGVVFGVATALVMRVTRSSLVSGYWLHFHVAWVLCWFTYHTGVHGPSMIWFALLPLLALMSNGRRAGIFWALVSGACVSAVFGLDLAGHEFPVWIDPASMQIVEWTSILSMIGGTFWVVMTYERHQAQTTHELQTANERLTEALQQAAAASRVKSAFLANTSHELRTPMNGVVGMTSLLMTTPLSNEQREYAETIHESAESLLSVIDEILDFSQLDAGKLKLAHLEFDLRERLESLIALLAERIGDKPLDLVTIVDEHVPERLIGDPVRLNQVITNLVDNALKFTDGGEVVLEIACAAVRGSEVELRVSVRDTGIGIAVSDQGTIFERFMQVDSSSRRRYGGTGLGLAISKQLVERMGGQIQVESAPGAGSTFSFTARLERAADTERSRRRIRMTGRVLIGPMQPGLLSFVERAMAARGLTPVRAESAADLEARLGELDLTVVDLDRTPVQGPRLIRLSRRKEGDLSKPVRAAQLDALLERITATDRKTACKVLVVEDNAVNQLVAATMIERLGYAVEVVASGPEALVRCEMHDYGVIVMDCHMPGMDGFETAAEIRRRERGRGARTPIIALTASAASEYRARCLDAGMDDFLTKPVELDTMQTILHRWAEPGDRGPQR